MDGALAIETNNITKAFGKFIAVDGLNLKVRVGSVHGLVGPNGSGKTTTIKMLVGALRCTAGGGSIKGHPIGSKEARRLMGYCPEHPSAYGDMNALDYLAHMARLSGVDGRDAGARSVTLLRSVDLDPFSSTRVARFSAGMKQRLGLAQALVHQPEVLVLDEPTANLDPEGRIWLGEKLKQLARGQKVSILISSHILPELEQFIDAVTLIDGGRLVAQDTVDALRAELLQNRYVLRTSDGEAVFAMMKGKPCVQEIWLDDDGIIHIVSEDPAALHREVYEGIVQRGISVKSFGEEQVRLEDVYRRNIGLG